MGVGQCRVGMQAFERGPQLRQRRAGTIHSQEKILIIDIALPATEVLPFVMAERDPEGIFRQRFQCGWINLRGRLYGSAEQAQQQGKRAYGHAGPEWAAVVSADTGRSIRSRRRRRLRTGSAAIRPDRRTEPELRPASSRSEWRREPVRR